MDVEKTATALGIAAALALGMGATPATASDWTSQDIQDHLRGKIGTGIVAKGIVADDRARRAGQLRAYCADNSTIVNLEAEYTHFGSGSMTVRYSLDGGPPQTARWDSCQGGSCVGLWGGQGIPFLKALFGKRELRVIVERRYTQALNATFAIEGAKEALAEVGEKCGWLPKGGNQK